MKMNSAPTFNAARSGLSAKRLATRKTQWAIVTAAIAPEVIGIRFSVAGQAKVTVKCSLSEATGARFFNGRAVGLAMPLNLLERLGEMRLKNVPLGFIEHRNFLLDAPAVGQLRHMVPNAGVERRRSRPPRTCC